MTDPKGKNINEDKSFYQWLFSKKLPVRTCPHCSVQMPEHEMLQHVKMCYSDSYSASNDGYHGQYRGSVAQVNGVIHELGW
ncbi:hypothetical protein I4U23_004393 [Adineta vaga]|nr:hypothetical protein I4U23_004393 [Adineta vaga]